MELTATSHEAELQNEPKIEHIGWDDLDKRKFYTIGPMIMLGVRLLIFPPMLIKTRLQFQKHTSLYTGTYDAFKKIFKYEGIRGFYKGFATNTVTLLSGQMYITTFEVVRAKAPVANETYKSLMAGGFASLSGQALTVPIDIVSQKQMMDGLKLSKGNQSVELKSAYTVARNIYRKSGVRGFYRGYIASIMTYTPSSGIWWSSYYYFTQLYGKARPEGVPNIVIQGLSGPSASIVAAILTNPADTIRTRMQVSLLFRKLVPCNKATHT